MRIVLDTNVLARAFASPSGPAGEVLDRIQSPHLLVLSTYILDELADVLGRERVRRLHRKDEAAISGFLQRLEAAALVVVLAEEEVPLVVPADRDDDFILATAVEGNADVICTWDKHLRHASVIHYCSDRSIQIVSDAELLMLLRKLAGSDQAGS